jgi:hypothetical protein
MIEIFTGSWKYRRRALNVRLGMGGLSGKAFQNWLTLNTV